MLDMEPLSVVDKPGFAHTISSLTNKFQPKGRTFYTDLLSKTFLVRREQPVANLEQATYIAATADCWTTYQRSYLGETVHWFTKDLKRRSACLAVRRVRGTHSFDVLGKLMEEIHVQFRIMGKLTATTTDGGSNFVKAFKEYGQEPNCTKDDEITDDETCGAKQEECVYFSLGIPFHS